MLHLVVARDFTHNEPASYVELRQVPTSSLRQHQLYLVDKLASMRGQLQPSLETFWKILRGQLFGFDLLLSLNSSFRFFCYSFYLVCLLKLITKLLTSICSLDGVWGVWGCKHPNPRQRANSDASIK